VLSGIVSAHCRGGPGAVRSRYRVPRGRISCCRRGCRRAARVPAGSPGVLGDSGPRAAPVFFAGRRFGERRVPVRWSARPDRQGVAAVRTAARVHRLRPDLHRGRPQDHPAPAAAGRAPGPAPPPSCRSVASRAQVVAAAIDTIADLGHRQASFAQIARTCPASASGRRAAMGIADQKGSSTPISSGGPAPGIGRIGA
jgi:hypothetical protein